MAESNTFKYENSKVANVQRQKILKNNSMILKQKLKPINLKITQFSIISLIAISGNKTMNALSDDDDGRTT